MSLWSWGSDIYGRLGHGTEDKNLAKPTLVRSLSKVSLRAVTCGSAHNVIVDSEGRCLTWGKCHYGQLGHGEQDKDEHVPRPVAALSGVSIVSVAAGDSHVIAISVQGQVHTWGVGFYGTLGHGDESSSPLPRLVEALRDRFVTAAAAGANHSLALTQDHRVLVWGRNHCGQLGLAPVSLQFSGPTSKPKLVFLNQKHPAEITLPSGASCMHLAACANHSIVLTNNGEVISFGCNQDKQLGRETTDAHLESHLATLIDPKHFKNTEGELEPVRLVSAGWKHCAALTESGMLYTWGHGAYGRLGQSHCRGSAVPQPVLDFPGRQRPRLVDIGCGESHTVALDNQGKVWAFGSGHYGKLGMSVDDSSYITAPQQVPLDISDANGVVCGTNHTILFRLNS